MRTLFFLALLLLSFCLQAQDPQVPVVTHVSVDSISQNVHVYWENSDPIVDGYYIYKKDVDGLWVILDTVPDAAIHHYVTADSNSDETIEYYSVASYDALGNYSQRSLEHNTLLLATDLPDCSRVNQLSWNPYVNMPGLEGYRLQVIAKKSATKDLVLDTTIYFPPTETSYAHENLDYSLRYRYIISAYNDLDSLAKGSRTAVTTAELNPPTFLYINRVTVGADDAIAVHALCDIDANVKSMRFFRSFVEGGLQQFVGESLVGADNEAVYLDESVFPETTEYHYTATVLDVCDNEYSLPAYHHMLDSLTVHNLQLTSKDDLTTNGNLKVQWTEYNTFFAPSEYSIWLAVNHQLLFIESVAEFGESVVDISDAVGKVCVYVQAQESTTNALGRRDSVLSNRICVLKEPRIYLPSAFTPNGDRSNDVWKAQIYGLEAVEQFDLSIFSSWGELVFKTQQLDFYWDGLFQGKKMPVGSYSFLLNYTYGEGVLGQQKGSVSILR